MRNIKSKLMMLVICVLTFMLCETNDVQKTDTPIDRIIIAFINAADQLFQTQYPDINMPDIQDSKAAEPDPAPENTIYRIRDHANTSASQIGAYYTFETAREMCPAGYCIFDQNGTLYYTG